MQILQDVLYRYHRYYHLYKTAFERIHELGDVPDLHVYLHFLPTTDQRRYNLLTAKEVTVIIPGDGTQPTENRDIILSTHAGPLKHITEINPAFKCLYYVLLFTYGEHEWHINIPLTLEADKIICQMIMKNQISSQVKKVVIRMVLLRGETRGQQFLS